MSVLLSFVKAAAEKPLALKINHLADEKLSVDIHLDIT
jgi:hypothetical protein